jgi:nitric oxide reductase large subunit
MTEISVIESSWGLGSFKILPSLSIPTFSMRSVVSLILLLVMITIIVYYVYKVKVLAHQPRVKKEVQRDRFTFQ